MSGVDFHNKTVAVSGGGIGFGKAICQLFAASGARVYACDILPQETDSAITYERIDLRDRGVAARWIHSIEDSVGRHIDVLVCNAGGVANQGFCPFEDVEDSDWDEVIAINLGSTMSLCRAAVSGMKRARSGAIVTISSSAGLQASMTGVQAYCASKHAIVGLTRQLAHELGPFGIRVNSVAPGFVVTNPATSRQWASYDDKRRDELVGSVARKRLGSVDEIANAVHFMASDRASFINGQILEVNGGR
jgi:3-oxoacyl-[acyl-carrier protein] reductase